MKGCLVGVILTLTGISLAVYFYFAKGMAPVATTARPMPLEGKLANLALHAKIKKEMPRRIPMEANEANLLAGAHLYLTHCAVCHGTPGRAQTAIARGEFPKPPALFEGKGVTDDPPGETYWKVANGIRLTGMPGFDKSLSEDEMWQVSLLLASAHTLPSAAMEVLMAGPAPTMGAQANPMQ